MTPKPIDRRQFLKGILAAGGAVTASAFLPAKWVKPLVRTGVLPVHAQSSLTSGMISGTVYISSDTSNPIGADFTVTASPTPPPPTIKAIAAGSYTGTTQSDGTYQILNVPFGQYYVYCGPANYANNPVTHNSANTSHIDIFNLPQ